MNAFYEHHKESIRFGCRCFDRILLNGLIQPFQQPERVVGFFGTYRQIYPVSRDRTRSLLGALGRLRCGAGAVACDCRPHRGGDRRRRRRRPRRGPECTRYFGHRFKIGQRDQRISKPRVGFLQTGPPP
jgi:hypothetical protein